MEGPSLVILKETLQPFAGKKVTNASGLARLDHSELKGRRILGFDAWGKHFLILLEGRVLRIHFLMFGSYRINERKETEPKLRLAFDDGQELNFYTTAVNVLDAHPDEIYDWSSDVMNQAWDPVNARRKLKKKPERNVGDALLDQEIFSGVGNIIKNEVLFRTQIHPESLIGALPPRKLTELIHQARAYSFDFYGWKKVFQLKQHWRIHTKKNCPRCNIPSVKKYTGLKKRRSFFCENCQILYTDASRTLNSVRQSKPTPLQVGRNRSQDV